MQDKHLRQKISIRQSKLVKGNVYGNWYAAGYTV